VTETLTVTGESPVVDTVHAGTTTNFNQEMLANIPSSRTQFFDTAAYVPGVKVNSVGSTTMTIFGSSRNLITYDGIDVTAPGGGTFDYPNYDMMQEFEVKAIGASAETAGFQGGQINMVLKSGSNDFRGTGSYYGSWNALLANNTPQEPFPRHIDHNHDFNYTFGGPIKKDRLWFQYIAEHVRRQQTNIGQDPAYGVEVRIWRPFIKVNARLSDRDNLSAHYNDCRDHWPGGGSKTAPLETTTVEVGYDPVVTARWTHIFGSKTLLDVKHGGIYVFKWNPPVSGDFTTPGRFDNGSGINSVNTPSFTRWRRQHPTMDASVAHTADDFLTGTHEFKFGVQYGYGKQVTDTARPSNTYLFDFNGRPDYALTREPTAVGGRVKTYAGFAQDNWTIASRMTLNLGVRYDVGFGDVQPMNQMDFTLQAPSGHTFPGVPDLINWKTVSPRLGVTYKLDQLGRTVAKSGYGRYYGKLVVGNVSQMSPGQTIGYYHSFNPATGKYDIPLRTSVPANNNRIDPNLRDEYTDQFFVGLERQIQANFGVNALFVYKKNGDPLGTIDSGGVYVPRDYVDTFDGVTQTLTVFNRTSPASQSLLLYTNRPDLRQSYRSFLIEANKRMSKRWQLQGSYQWQRDLSSTPTSSGAGSSGDPNAYINGYGRSASDNTHSVRASATFGFPYDIQLGVRYFFDDGRPYARQVTIPRAITTQGNTAVIAQPIGAYQYPDLHDVRLRFDKAFRFGSQRRLRVSLDILNALNTAAATNVRNNSTQTTFPFGTLFSVVEGRRAQLGLRFEF
jgi:outer membrane receptor protein involved in Fe transport